LAQNSSPNNNNSLTPANTPPADESQLPITVWLKNNGIFLAIMVAIVCALFRYVDDVETIWSWTKAGLGLGFVIFFHELGHFAVAKWCDVHVQTFSIGFGPALPGCSFRRGETLYKLAIIPLGGYVKMVGEGSESEEEDDDPRSFKNKTVGQRMAIISAGVIMNVILGCICFIIAYRSGVKVIAPVLAAVEPGSPAWKKGIQSGSLIEKIGNIQFPKYDDLKFEVMLSQRNQKVFLRITGPDGKTRDLDIEPRREEYDAGPVIGVLPSNELKLVPERDGKKHDLPVAVGPAAAARVLNLKPEDVLLASTDPDNPSQLRDLPAGPDAFLEFGKRLEKLVGQTVKVRVGRPGQAGGTEQEVAAAGFHYGDAVIGTTVADQTESYTPYKTTDLPLDTLRDKDGKRHDYFAYLQRMQQLTGKPVVMVVERRGSTGQVRESVFVPAAFERTLGLRMGMGPVTALRDNSPGDAAGVKPKDILKQLELVDGDGNKARWVTGRGKVADGRSSDREIDALRLPFDLRQWATNRKSVKAFITVSRKNEKTHRDDESVALDSVPWDPAWQFDQEELLNSRSPLSIPELGIAYLVDTRVDAVAADSPAAKADLREGDVIMEVRFKEKGRGGKEDKWSSWFELYTDEKGQPGGRKPEPWWALKFSDLQENELPDIQVKVRRGSEDLADVKDLSAVSDPNWPSDKRGIWHDSRGMIFEADVRLQKADSNLAALGMGVERTRRSIVQVYISLYSMVTNRLSPTKNLRGPIDIASTAKNIAGEDLTMFVLFLGIISINLAVVNFLPIPVLDGGHMVFLIYEKVRGKPASEGLRVAATYLGLLLILSLMGFVVYLDLDRRSVFPWSR
jgi:regulator of sigma E protease